MFRSQARAMGRAAEMRIELADYDRLGPSGLPQHYAAG